MSKWKRLDLTTKSEHPGPDELVALRMVPKTGLVCGTGAKYKIGHLQPDPRSTSKKLWWHEGNWGSDDPAQLKQHYDIWWCCVNPFDGV